jgi:hypothetical protein
VPNRNVSDRICLHIEGTETVMAALVRHWNYIMAETLASQWMSIFLAALTGLFAPRPEPVAVRSPVPAQ